MRGDFVNSQLTRFKCGISTARKWIAISVHVEENEIKALDMGVGAHLSANMDNLVLMCTIVC